MTNVVQRSFAGGEIAPSLYGRTDQVKYATGLRTCRNFTVQRHGGVTNRAGTGFVGETKGSARVRLLKFVFNDEQAYLLEFGDRYLRIVQNGGQVVTSGVAAWVTATDYLEGDLVTRGGTTYYCTATHTSGATTEPGVGASWQSNWYAQTGALYEIPTPYLAADLSTLQIVQSADVVTIVHPNYPIRELRRAGHTRWTLPLKALAPSIGAPTNVSSSGGGAGVATYWAVTAIDGATGEEGLPVFYSAINRIPSSGTPTTLTWDPVPNAIGYRVYRSTDGQTYGLLGPSGGTPGTTSDTSWTTTLSNVSTSLDSTYVTAVDQARNPVVAVVTDKSYDGNYAVRGKITVSAVFPGGAAAQGRVRAYYSRDGEPRVDAGIVSDNHFVNGEDSAVFAFTGTVSVPDNGYATLTIDLVAEVWGSVASGAPVFTATIDTSIAPDNVISWQGTGRGYIDTGLVPDYLGAPPTQQTLFQSDGSYPSAVAYFQQRQLFGNSTTDPTRVWGSRSGRFGSFTRSTPLQDDDAVDFSLASRQVNAIRHMIDLGGLIVFTASGVWVGFAGDNDVLTPTFNNTRQRLYYGSSMLPPLVLGSVVLFVQARGARVRDLFADIVSGYKANDLTLFAQHLVDGYTLIDWDLAPEPHSNLWAVRSDGVLLGLTYIREQEVWGWHRHDTDGVIENVCVLPEGTEDRLYLVVRRIINNVTKRYIERMHVRTMTATTDVRDLAFVDCGLSYDGRNTGATTITLSGGVAWDEGEQLTCTASAATFAAGDVGKALFVYDGAGAELVRLSIEGYTSNLIVTVRANKLVPVSSRAVATTAWALAARTFAGLAHLEGKDVSVFADGVVAASPNNEAYTVVTVAGGQITLDAPAAVVHVGLPYISDLETLDIDTPSGPSLKDKKLLVNKVGIYVERSRGVFAGAELPTGDDPLLNMDEFKVRDPSDGYGPITLRTEVLELDIPRDWDSHGRVALREVDPVPLTVLGVIPQGIF